MTGSSGGRGGLESGIMAGFLTVHSGSFQFVCGIVWHIVVVGGVACFLAVDDMVECVTA